MRLTPGNLNYLIQRLLAKYLPLQGTLPVSEIHPEIDFGKNVFLFTINEPAFVLFSKMGSISSTDLIYTHVNSLNSKELE